ncbi:MAG: polyhydroxyalkanoate depolymerase [Alphaproteobacteria bacterium]|nr:polyhydroxyalkanoate depolymerase [Alphaproteobacteria bacterium]
MDERVLAATPFCELVHLARDRAEPAPRLLLVAPLSGHRPVVLRDLALGLLPAHDLHLLCWRDAAEIPPEAGRFTLDENVGHILSALVRLGEGVHVLGVSQSPLPCLAAAALAAERGVAPLPASLILMGGLLDPALGPTPIARLATALPRVALERMLTTARNGRRVYPATAQALALTLYLRRHLLRGGELRGKVLRDDGIERRRFPFLSLFYALSDLPAELFLDLIETVFHHRRLPNRTLLYDNQPVRPEAIGHTALMTVEGGRDDVSGPGQTHVAQSWCPDAPARLILTVPEAGHFGLFHGRPFRQTVLPAITAFVRP